MKLLNSSLITVLAGLALATAPVHAAITFNQGDLLLGIRASGGAGAGTSYLVNIGSMATYRDASGSMALSLGNLDADLDTLFGSNWHDRTDLLWSVAGSPSATSAFGGDPSDTVYVTRAQPTVGEPGTPWSANNTNRGTASSDLQAISGAYAAGTATVNSSVAILQDEAALNSWRSYQPGGANTPAGVALDAFNGSIEARPDQTLSLFRLNSASPGSFEGTFAIDQNGVVTFSAVPEPTTGLLAGLGTMLVVFRRRRAVANA